jgi:hypothetical protein
VTGRCAGAGLLGNEGRDIKITAVGKKKWRYACRLFETNSLKEGAMWHVYPLVGNDREISKNPTAVAKYRLQKQACFHGNKRIQQ